MDTDVLRIFTANYITESDINFKHKMELLEFVKVAEKEEILNLLVFGKPTEVVSENYEFIFEAEVMVGNIISCKNS